MVAFSKANFSGIEGTNFVDILQYRAKTQTEQTAFIFEDKLRYRAPKGRLTPTEKEEVHQYKAELMKKLPHAFDWILKKPTGKTKSFLDKLITQISPPFLVLENQSLLSLFTLDKIDTLDPAALCCLPSYLFQENSLNRDLVPKFLLEKPFWAGIIETDWGRLAIILLPIFDFVSELAIKRFQTSQDILFTEGGALHSPRPLERVMCLPQPSNILKKEMGSFLAKEYFFLKNSSTIMGCMFSSILTNLKWIKSTIGTPNLENCLINYKILANLGFQGADLHCEDYVLEKQYIDNFRKRFGKNTG